MKKLTKLVALATAVSALFFAGCDNGLNKKATVEGVERETREVTLTVTSDSDLIKFSAPKDSDSRSILPDAYESDDVWFYLTYKKPTENDWQKPTAVTFTGTPGAAPADPASTKEGTVVINLAQALYDLELFAVKKAGAETKAPNVTSESDARGKACLMASAQADLRHGNSVNFFLTSEGLTKTGDIKLQLYAQGWDPDEYKGYTVTADLKYTKDTVIGATNNKKGTTVSNSLKTLIATPTNTTPVSDKTGSNNGIVKLADAYANYTPTGIPAGTYLFEVRFEKDGKTFYWNDDLKVLPDQTTEVTVGITPTIDLPPSKPKDFAAGYIDNLNSEYYKLEFTWDASEINNETNFRIELLTVPGAVDDTAAKNPTSDSEWDTILSGSTPSGGSPELVTLTTEFVGNETMYEDGSLGKNSQVAVVRAAYGKRYVARICSVNEIGDSDWVYCDISSDITADASTGAIDATGFMSTTINRYKITYNLSNGTLEDASSDPVPVVYGASQLFVKRTADNATPPTSTYFSVESGTTKYYFYDDTGDGSGSLTGVEIMQPDGNTDFNWDDKGTPTTITKPLLLLNSAQKWTNWTLDGANWNEIGSAVKPYGGFENLNLVANYATLAKVTLFDDKDYTIASVDSDVTFEGDDGASHYWLTLAQDTNTTNVWTITPPTDVRYDYVTVILYKTNSKKDYYTVPVTYDVSNNEYTATLDVVSYRTGIYRAEICAYSPVRPNDPYTAQIGVVIVDTIPGATPPAPPASPVYAIGGTASITDASPDFTMDLSSVTLTKDGVDFKASETWSYTWTFNGGTLPATVTASGNTLTISSPADPSENGTYTCTATGTTSGKTISANVIVS